jgi:hypothetical protein
MKSFLLFIALLFSGTMLSAQCTNAPNGQWPGNTIDVTCGGSGWSNGVCWTGEYTVINVEVGKTYTFSSSVGSDYLTITNAANAPLVWGTGPRTWTATYNGTVRFYRHLSSSCNHSQVSRTCTVTCANQPAGNITFYFGDNQDWEYISLGDELIDVPVKTSGFSSMGGFQFTVDLGECLFANGEEGPNNRNAFLSIVDVVNIHPTLTANLEVDIDNSGQFVTFVWNAASPLTLTNGTKLFDIRVQGPGQYEFPCCTHLEFTDTPITIEAFNFNFEPLNVTAEDEHHICEPQLKICGCITREDGIGIGQVTVKLYELLPGFPNPISWFLDSLVTGPDGCYEFMDLESDQTYIIVPSKTGTNNENSHKNGVNVTDVRLIREYAAGKPSLDSPYKIVSADVVTDTRVTALDALFTQRLVSPSAPNTFDPQPSWKFVPSDYNFPSINPPLSYNDSFPMQRTVFLDAEYCEENFIGMKLGDVNLTNNPANALRWGLSQRSTGYELLKTDSTVVNKVAGAEFNLTVRAADFQKVKDFQSGIKFDQSKIEFIGVAKDEFGLPLSSLQGLFVDEGNAPKDEGRLYFSWFDNTGAPDGISLPDDALIVQLVFRLLDPSLQEIIFVQDTLTDNYYTNELDRAIPTQIQFGRVRVDIVNSLNDQEMNLELIISPNPASDQLHIQLGKHLQEPVHITLMDYYGNALMSRIIENSVSLPLNSLPAGNYILKAQGQLSGRNVLHKFVKM